MEGANVVCQSGFGPNDIMLTSNETALLNFHPNRIMHLYFDPISSDQKKIIIINSLEEFLKYYETQEYIFFHYMDKVENKASVEEILSSLENVPHIKLGFNLNIIIFTGKNKNYQDLFIKIKGMRVIIDP